MPEITRGILIVIILVLAGSGAVAGAIWQSQHKFSIGTPTSPANFSHIIIVAMENQNYGSVIGSTSAPFINTMATQGTVLSNYQAYSQNINGCSHGCYEAFTAGNQLLADGGCPKASSPCSGAPQPSLSTQLHNAGLTSALFCEDDCPRGSDHFPWIEYTDTWNSCVLTFAASCSGQAGPTGDLIYNSASSGGNTAFINYLNAANPASYIWFTPTDSHNMHDNSVSSGDAYIQNLLVGTGTLTSPSAGSVFASSLWKAGQTLFYLWWDENSNPPMVLYGPMVKIGFTATETLNEYYMLHMIENNWGLPAITTVVSGDTAPTDLFTASGPLPLTASFTFSPTTVNPSQTVTFTGTATGGTSPYTFTWNFGDSSSSAVQNPTHSYTAAGTYTIKLNVSDSSSPRQVAAAPSQTLTVTAPCTTSCPPATAPYVNGWATGITEVEHTAAGNPASKVFSGQTATNFEYAIQQMQSLSSGYNGVRVDFDSTCGNTGSFPQAYNSADLAKSIQIAQFYNFWIIVDYHSYNDIFNSQSCWLSFWSGVVTANAAGYGQIIWEPENEPAYGQATGSIGTQSCTGGVANGLACLALSYQAFINQARTAGDTHWIVIQNVCSFGCSLTGTGAGDGSGALNGWPTVTDTANRLLYSIHAYMQLGNTACGTNAFTLAYAQCDAQAFFNAVSSAQAGGKAMLNTELGADEFSNLGGCGSPGPQPSADVILCGSAGYSNITLIFVQKLYSLYNGKIGTLWWTAGDWTNTPTAGPLGALQCNSSPKGWGCVLTGGNPVTTTAVTLNIADQNGATLPSDFGWEILDSTYSTILFSSLSNTFPVTLNQGNSYGTELFYRTYLLTKGTITTSTATSQLFATPVNAAYPTTVVSGGYVVVNSTLAGTNQYLIQTTAELKFTLTNSATGPFRIVASVPSIPLYVQKNGVNVTFTYDSARSVAIINTSSLSTWDFIFQKTSSGPITASFTMSPSNPTPGQSITVLATATGGTPPYLSYSWTWGDGTTTTGQTSQHYYLAVGTYTITLTVTDSGTPPATGTAMSQAVIATYTTGGGGGGGGGYLAPICSPNCTVVSNGGSQTVAANAAQNPVSQIVQFLTSPLFGIPLYAFVILAGIIAVLGGTFYYRKQS